MKHKWTDQEIDILKRKWKSMVSSQLVALLPGRTQDAINKKLKRIGVVLSDKDISWRMKYAQSFVNPDNICKTDQSIKFDDLNNLTTQLLLGSMLGDGSSNKQSKNLRYCRFTEGHGLKQSDYVIWKSELLSLFKPRITYGKDRTNLTTLTHPIFNVLREKFYISSQKSVVPVDLLHKIDLFGLMVWFLDDGFYHKSPGYTLSISAMGWELDGLQRLSGMLNSKFNLSTYVYLCKHKNGKNKTIKFPFKDRTIVDSWIKLAKRTNLPACMAYKFKGEQSSAQKTS